MPEEPKAAGKLTITWTTLEQAPKRHGTCLDLHTWDETTRETGAILIFDTALSAVASCLKRTEGDLTPQLIAADLVAAGEGAVHGAWAFTVDCNRAPDNTAKIRVGVWNICGNEQDLSFEDWPVVRFTQCNDNDVANR